MAETETIPETPPAAPVTVAPTTTPEVAPSPSDWRASLPEDIRTAPELAKYADINALAKGHLEQSKLVGRKVVGVPGPDAKPEDVAAFRKALGVPDSPEGYTIKPHPMMIHPEWNQDAQAAFMKLAHDNAMTPAQVEKAMHWYGDFMAQQVKANEVMNAEAKGELRAAWGVNYDAYLGAANRGLSRMEAALGMEAGELVEATKGSNPAAIAKLFHHIESIFTEHGWVAGEAVRGMSSEEARTKIQDIDAQLAKLDPNSDRARELVELKYQYMSAARRAA